MIKKILLAFLGLCLLLVIGLYFFGSSLLSSGIQKGVVTIGPKVTQTSVELESVDLSILSGDVKLNGLNIGNPKGYQSEYIFALGEIDLGIQLSTLMSDKIVIDRIIIRKPAISYESKLSTSNVKQILENIESFTGGPSAENPPAEETPAEESGASKQVLIKQVLVEGGTVYVGILGAGQSVALPKIELSNVGEDRNLTIAQAANIIVQEILKAIGPAISEAGGIDAILKGAASGDDSALKEATENIKGLFGK